jgi:DNA-binding MarR family transcriptional regulator
MLLNRACETTSALSTPAELADEAGVTRATMTGLLDTLEKDNLVARESDPNDRRTVLIRLTDKGRSLLEGLLPDFFRRVCAVIDPLSEDERLQLVGLLQKVQQGLAAATPEPAEPALATA